MRKIKQLRHRLNSLLLYLTFEERARARDSIKRKAKKFRVFEARLEFRSINPNCSLIIHY